MRLKVNLDPALAETTREEPLSGMLHSVAKLLEAELEVGQRAEAAAENVGPRSIRSGAQTVGEISGDVAAADSNSIELMARVLEHSLEREAAVADLSRALLDAYNELNLLYGLLPTLATKADEREIGEILVAETARALGSQRVVLAALEENTGGLRVLAERGGALSGTATTIEQVQRELSLAARQGPALDSPSAMSCRPLLQAPLNAQNTMVGTLFVSQRENSGDYNSHDQKLLQTLAATGASAILNCRMHENLRRMMIGTIEALAAAVDAKDAGTHDHSRRVADYCMATARRLNLPQTISLQELELAGLLHDVGKIGVPDSILCKPGKLTSEEYEIIKKHVRIGADILQNVASLKRMRDCVLHHHERFDGRGYPDGLKGKAIPLGARIIAIADAFDVIVSDRPYRKGASKAEAIAELRRCSGGHFDPEVVEAFIQVVQ